MASSEDAQLQMEQHVKIDLAAQGWYSQKGGASTKGHFRRKYMFVRPKYTADKIHKIREVIHKRRKEEITEERERQRKEQEEAASKEAVTGKRKQMEEEEAKAQRLSDLKAKAETLRQEKSTLFGMLKQALIEEAKKKQREERAERLRKEEQDKKDKKERALAEAAQALAGAANIIPPPIHPNPVPRNMNPMMSKMGPMGGMTPGGMTPGGMTPGMVNVPGMPMTYGHQPHGSSFLSPRQGFYGGPSDSPRGGLVQGAAAAGRGFPHGQAPSHPGPHPGAGPGFGSQVGVGPGGVARSMLGSLHGQNQRFMNMQAYQNQSALLAGRMVGGAMASSAMARASDHRPPPPPHAPPQMDGRDPNSGQPGQQPGQQPLPMPGRGRGMFYPPPRGGFGYQGQDRRW